MAENKISILLSRAALDCLRSHAAGDPAVAACLDRAEDITGVLKGTPVEFVLSCDELEVEALMVIAIAHCPDAMSELAAALAQFKAQKT